MNTQTKIPTFPLGYHYITEQQALTQAKEYSKKLTDQFIYVIFSTSYGKYRLDYIGLKYSDEKIVATINNGEKTL